jgi:adenosylhomocysteinase
MPYHIADINKAPEGRRKIEWISGRMPVLNSLYERFLKKGTFKGKTVAVSIHLEAKTAYLCLILKRLGADVWATGSNPFSTKDEVTATLAEEDINVFAKYGVSEEEHQIELDALISSQPEVILDDGADICHYIHKRPECGIRLKGISEETTTGVIRLKRLEQESKLLFPTYTVNEAKSKHLFDNRYGTGQSTWTSITHLTNMTIAGRNVVVIGYGWVGRGVATIARGMGAQVIITEIDPWKSLEAHMDGYRVMTLKDACKIGDIIITATGLEHVVREEHFKLMKDGVLIGNSGHSDLEADVPRLNAVAIKKIEARENIFEYTLNSGKHIYMLADGRIVNIAGGLGHPAEILDMSFALQLASLENILTQPKANPGVYPVPNSIDESVVREKLLVEGIQIDS